MFLDHPVWLLWSPTFAAVLAKAQVGFDSRAEATPQAAAGLLGDALLLFCFDLLLLHSLQAGCPLQVSMQLSGITHGWQLQAWIARHNTCGGEEAAV